MPPGTIVPNDARALEADLRQLRAELAARRAADASAPDPFYRPRPPHGTGGGGHRLTGPLTVLALALLVALGSLIAVMLPGPNRAPIARPLATTTTASGYAGGLVPDVTLSSGTATTVRLRAVRPAVLLIFSDQCRCAGRERAAADKLAMITVTYGLPMVLVGQSTVPPLPATASSRRIRTVSDPARSLAAALHPPLGDTPAAALVRSDGIITRVVPDVSIDDLDPELAALAS